MTLSANSLCNHLTKVRTVAIQSTIIWWGLQCGRRVIGMQYIGELADWRRLPRAHPGHRKNVKQLASFIWPERYNVTVQPFFSAVACVQTSRLRRRIGKKVLKHFQPHFLTERWKIWQRKLADQVTHYYCSLPCCIRVDGICLCSLAFGVALILQ